VNNVKSGPFGSVLVDCPPGSLELAEPLPLESVEGDVGGGLLVPPPAELIEELGEADELASSGTREIEQASEDMTSPAANNPTAIADFLGIHHS
jgi:hypothetical protein